MRAKYSFPFVIREPSSSRSREGERRKANKWSHYPPYNNIVWIMIIRRRVDDPPDQDVMLITPRPHYTIISLSTTIYISLYWIASTTGRSTTSFSLFLRSSSLNRLCCQFVNSAIFRAVRLPNCVLIPATWLFSHIYTCHPITTRPIHMSAY